MPEPITFLAHRAGDDVAVAVRDAEPGESPGAYLDDGTRVMITVRAPIPLGHKVALRDLATDEPVTEYGAAHGRPPGPRSSRATSCTPTT